MPRRYPPPMERLAALTDRSAGPDSCWIWKGCFDRKGYGEFRLNGPVEKAHRAAYMIAKGPIPEGMCVCHSCDNRACVNPAHLWLGTNSDNMRDASVKDRRIGRPQPGATNGSAKLTAKQVVKIRARLAAREKVARIAASYGVSLGTIYHIRRGYSWNEGQPRNRKRRLRPWLDEFIAKRSSD